MAFSGTAFKGLLFIPPSKFELLLFSISLFCGKGEILFKFSPPTLLFVILFEFNIVFKVTLPSFWGSLF